MARSGTIIMLADGNALPVWVDKHFVGVKAISVVHLTRTINAVSVELSSHDSWYKDVPVMRSTIDVGIERYNSGRLLSIGVIEQYDLDSRGVS
jgi:hypothetical protein